MGMVIRKMKNLALGPVFIDVLAEAVKFELTDPCGSAVFKTAGLNRSPKPPGLRTHTILAGTDWSLGRGGLPPTLFHGDQAWHPRAHRAGLRRHLYAVPHTSTPGRWCTAPHTSAGTAIQARDTGHLCRLHLSGLQHAASEADCTLHLHVRPRSFVGPDTVLVTACARKRSKDIANIERNRGAPRHMPRPFATALCWMPHAAPT